MKFRASLWYWPQTIGLMGHSLGSLGLVKVDVGKEPPKTAAGESPVVVFYRNLMKERTEITCEK